MTLRRIIPVAAAAMASVFALSACTEDGPARQQASRVPEARVTGEPERCIPLHMIRESRVRDDRTIDFIAGGNRAWRNTLPHRCAGLNASNGFSYETSLSQLCSTDIIHVLVQMGGGLERGASCGLGQFVPVELAR